MIEWLNDWWICYNFFFYFYRLIFDHDIDLVINLPTTTPSTSRITSWSAEQPSTRASLSSPTLRQVPAVLVMFKSYWMGYQNLYNTQECTRNVIGQTHVTWHLKESVYRMSQPCNRGPIARLHRWSIARRTVCTALPRNGIINKRSARIVNVKATLSAKNLRMLGLLISGISAPGSPC